MPSTRFRFTPYLGSSWWLHVLLIVLAIAVALAIIIRLVLDPLATAQTRAALDRLDGFTGDFQKVHVSVLPPRYEISRLKLFPAKGAGVSGGGEPLFYVERAYLSLSLDDLLHAKLSARLRLEKPKFAFQPPTGSGEAQSEGVPDLSRQLAELPPLLISRVEVLDGEIVFRQVKGDRRPTLWIHDLELTAQNLGTRRERTNGRPATVSAHAVVARSGVLDLFVSADPLARPLNFAGEASLRALRATALYEFLAANADLQATQGTVDLFVSFIAKHGVITGGVKPVLKNIEIRALDDDFWDRAKAWLVDASVELASDRVPGRNAVATIFPIKGRLADAQVQLWPAVLGVIRNAFVIGVRSGFADLPPPTADQRESVLKQAKHALDEDAGPPKAQPIKR